MEKECRQEEDHLAPGRLEEPTNSHKGLGYRRADTMQILIHITVLYPLELVSTYPTIRYSKTPHRITNRGIIHLRDQLIRHFGLNR